MTMRYWIPIMTMLALPIAARAEAGTVLDQVVAVVNNRPILESEIEETQRMTMLDPANGRQEKLTAAEALDQLIGRTLIEQQIRQQDKSALEVSEDEIREREAEMRRQLPACAQGNCQSDLDWQNFLARQGVTREEVQSATRHRIQILRFIEVRFRQGIQIDHDAVANYYNKTLLPQYKAGDAIPKLEEVATRIEEILLEQQVNILFDEWLSKLRTQGDIEILAAEYKPTAETTNGAETKR